MNPWKTISLFETNVFLKTAMVTVGGAGMGFLMAMFMNAWEMRHK